MSRIDAYSFDEPLIDLRSDTDGVAALAAELVREVAPGHPLHGTAWRVIGRALPTDDILVQNGDRVAFVHLTWTGKQDRPPWPWTNFVGSGDELDAHVEGYDWD